MHLVIRPENNTRSWPFISFAYHRLSNDTFVLHMNVHVEGWPSRQTVAMSHKQADPSLNFSRRPLPDVLQFNKYFLPVYIFCLFLLFSSNESFQQCRVWTLSVMIEIRHVGRSLTPHQHFQQSNSWCPLSTCYCHYRRSTPRTFL